MKVPHTDFTEVPWVILVEVGAVVVLATGHTATTGMLSVLTDSSMTGGDVAAAEEWKLAILIYHGFPRSAELPVSMRLQHSMLQRNDGNIHTVSASSLLW